eukprot:15323940-Ditylum_brightwellii.AAC.1
MASSSNASTRAMTKTAQKELDTYIDLAAATGGKLIPEKDKNSWYLIECKWKDNSKWILEDNGADIIVRTGTSKTKVNRLTSSTASKILGVLMAPNSESSKLTKELVKKLEAWADRVRTGHLQQGDALTYY